MTGLLFIHGWLGNSQWWDKQVEHFSSRYKVIAMDLPRHNIHSSKDYAHAIKAAADKAKSQDLILIGHSMSGAYALEASLLIPKTKAVILIDTLKNLDLLMSLETAEKALFDVYRKDFHAAIELILPKFLFSKDTPLDIQKKLKDEFRRSTSEEGISAIRPLYEMDIQNLAKLINVPVIAINSDFTPTSVENNQKYFKNYKLLTIAGTGHYPMLENPQEFNVKLEEALTDLKV